ncbi:Protein of unknown function [Gryllus bimaculatus]|nr:Protein of unknown function [Gryllus bimaculatus]
MPRPLARLTNPCPPIPQDDRVQASSRTYPTIKATSCQLIDSKSSRSSASVVASAVAAAAVAESAAWDDGWAEEGVQAGVEGAAALEAAGAGVDVGADVGAGVDVAGDGDVAPAVVAAVEEEGGAQMGQGQERTLVPGNLKRPLPSPSPPSSSSSDSKPPRKELSGYGSDQSSRNTGNYFEVENLNPVLSILSCYLKLELSFKTNLEQIVADSVMSEETNVLEEDFRIKYLSITFLSPK